MNRGLFSLLCSIRFISIFAVGTADKENYQHDAERNKQDHTAGQYCHGTHEIPALKKIHNVHERFLSLHVSTRMVRPLRGPSASHVQPDKLNPLILRRTAACSQGETEETTPKKLGQDSLIFIFHCRTIDPSTRWAVQINLSCHSLSSASSAGFLFAKLVLLGQPE